MYSQHHQPLRLYVSAVDSSRDSTLEERFQQVTEAIETLDKAVNGKAKKDLGERVRSCFDSHTGTKHY